MSRVGQGQVKQMVKGRINILTQLSGISLSPEGFKLVAQLVTNGPSLAKSVKRRLSLVKATFEGFVLSDEDFFVQTHYGLKEVVIEPHQVIELIEQISVSHRIKPVIAEISPDQG